MPGPDVLVGRGIGVAGFVAMIAELSAFNTTDGNILLGNIPAQICSGRLRQCGRRRPSKNEGDLVA